MGDFNYDREFMNWKWDIPDNYNIGYDCVDKHTLTNKKNKVALFWEDSEGDSEIFTFNDMKNLTNRFGNALKNLGKKKKDIEMIKDAKSTIQKAFDLYKESGYSEYCDELKDDIAQVDKLMGKYNLEDE